MNSSNIPTHLVHESSEPSLPVVIESSANTFVVPAIIANEGERASERFFTFFTDDIRNPNTRAAYFRNACCFLDWCHVRGFLLKSYHVSAHIEELSQTHTASSVKQRPSTLRRLFDWLIVGHVVEANPAHAERGPKYVVKKGKTPVLDEENARKLSISGTDVTVYATGL